MSPFRSQAQRDFDTAQSALQIAQHEAATLREEINAIHERSYEAEQRRRRERQQEVAETERQADDWKEGLRKYKQIMQGELAELDKLQEADTWVVKARIDWQTYTRQADAALAMWRKEEERIAPEIALLEAQITQLRDSIHPAVADELSAQFPGNDLSRAMLEDDPTDFLQTV